MLVGPLSRMTTLLQDRSSQRWQVAGFRDAHISRARLFHAVVRDKVSSMAKLIDAAIAKRSWTRPVTKIVRHAEQNGAHIVGITGVQQGIGVSLLASLLAQTYADFGKNVLLVDASQEPPLDAATTASDVGPAALLELAQDSGSYLTVNISEHRHRLPKSAAEMRNAFDIVTAQGMTIVVDLPAVETMKGPDAGENIAGAACDHIFLLCVSGRTKKADLVNSMEICRIYGLKIGGIVANDQSLWGSHLLED